VFQML